MSGSNFRIVQTEEGYSIFEVFYDSAGQVVRRSPRPIIDCFAGTACGVTDWLESISLAAEKPPLSLEQMNEALKHPDTQGDP